MPVSPSLAVLLVCRNRRDLTLGAMATLEAARRAADMRTHVVLFDDASTDGTVEAVLAAYPDTVIVRGDGNAFWSKGLYLCWKAALALPVEAFLWLNDDVALEPTALQDVAAAWREASARQKDGRFILIGATRQPGTSGEISYSGKMQVKSPWALRFETVSPSGELRPVDTFNGNFVVISRPLTDAIGISDPNFFHAMADIDYGLRAKAARAGVWLMPRPIGACERNAAKFEKGYGSPKLTLRQQWAKVNSHHGLPMKSWARFTLRHSGIWFPFHFLVPYRHLVIPRIRRRAI